MHGIKIMARTDNQDKEYVWLYYYKIIYILLILLDRYLFSICKYLHNKSSTCTTYIMSKKLCKITGKISFTPLTIKFYIHIHNISSSPTTI